MHARVFGRAGQGITTLSTMFLHLLDFLLLIIFLCCFGSQSSPILMVKFLKSNLKDHISTIWETLTAAYYGAAYHAYLEEQFFRKKKVPTYVLWPAYVFIDTWCM